MRKQCLSSSLHTNSFEAQHMCVSSAPVIDLTVTMKDTEGENSDPAVAQKWFEFMVNMPGLKHLDPQDEVTSRAVLKAAKEASGESTFDRALAQQMNALDVNEREQQFEEVHGVARIVDETPQLVSGSLNDFSHTVMTVKHKPWYDHALTLNRTYIEGDKFRLMFLRAEMFNVTKAVVRMFLFLEKKAKFFGAHTLGRPLQLSDLDEEAMKVLGSGDFQVLPSRDRAGRPILFQVSPHCGKKSYDCGLPLFKAWFYLHINLFEEDEESQKRGAVLLFWWMAPFASPPAMSAELYDEAFYLIRWLPMRPYCSLHICMRDTLPYHILARLLIATTPREIRYNHKIHAGSCYEVMYRLLPFGIPTEALPVSTSGEIKMKGVHRWFDRRLKREEFSRTNPFLPFDKFELPAGRDILFAKGKPYRSHQGNVDFLVLINELVDDYDAANRKDRRTLILKVIRTVKDNGAEFLTLGEDGWWIMVRDKLLIDKVSKAFANASRKKATQGVVGEAIASARTSPVISEQGNHENQCFGFARFRP